MYYYFEIVWRGEDHEAVTMNNDLTKIQIRNANELKFQPQTNSSGIWGYRFTSDSRHPSRKWGSSKIIDQLWLDMSKYDHSKNDLCYTLYKYLIDNIIPNLKNDQKINKESESIYQIT